MNQNILFSTQVAILQELCFVLNKSLLDLQKLKIQTKSQVLVFYIYLAFSNKDKKDKIILIASETMSAILHRDILKNNFVQSIPVDTVRIFISIYTYKYVRICILIESRKVHLYFSFFTLIINNKLINPPLYFEEFQH